MEGSGGVLGAFGTHLGTSWALFGRLMDALGCLFGTSWASWVHLGPSGADLRSILEGVGRGLRGSWAPLGRSWPLLGRFGGASTSTTPAKSNVVDVGYPNISVSEGRRKPKGTIWKPHIVSAKF